MKKLLILPLICLMGCASINGVATIKEIKGGVEFNAKKEATMSMEKADGTKYNYTSQSESLLSKIVSVLSLGIVGAK